MHRSRSDKRSMQSQSRGLQPRKRARLEPHPAKTAGREHTPATPAGLALSPVFGDDDATSSPPPPCGPIQTKMSFANRVGHWAGSMKTKMSFANASLNVAVSWSSMSDLQGIEMELRL